MGSRQFLGRNRHRLQAVEAVEELSQRRAGIVALHGGRCIADAAVLHAAVEAAADAVGISLLLADDGVQTAGEVDGKQPDDGE